MTCPTLVDALQMGYNINTMVEDETSFMNDVSGIVINDLNGSVNGCALGEYPGSMFGCMNIDVAGVMDIDVTETAIDEVNGVIDCNTLSRLVEDEHSGWRKRSSKVINAQVGWSKSVKLSLYPKH